LQDKAPFEEQYNWGKFDIELEHSGLVHYMYVPDYMFQKLSAISEP
jgi:hypothetical protein